MTSSGLVNCTLGSREALLSSLCLVPPETGDPRFWAALSGEWERLPPGMFRISILWGPLGVRNPPRQCLMAGLDMAQLTLRDLLGIQSETPEEFSLSQFGGTYVVSWGFPGGLVVKNLPVKLETWVWSLGQEDSLEKAMADPLQCSCLENPMDRGAWCTRVHGVIKSWTWLSD